MIKPYWQDKLRTLYNHDCRTMPELADNSIQMVVTSPPYWGLRKYAGEQNLIWGGKPDCTHDWNEKQDFNASGGPPKLDYELKKHFTSSSSSCSLCGAWRGAYGLEPTPELYIAHSIEILREIRRVLRKDGVVFWNIGDSYAGSGQGWSKNELNLNSELQQGNKGSFSIGDQPPGYISSKQKNGLKPKDMCLIPERLKIAAQEDGWWIRSTIIWSKNNPMPESVTDRPTESHEYIIMLTKSARYYWDQEAVREPHPESYWERMKYPVSAYEGQSGETSWVGTKDNCQRKIVEPTSGRNLRSVWTFSTQPYREAHFATFPEELPERCIKAASKEGDVVLDPFSGSGTTMKVAAELNRQAVGYELSKEYCDLIIRRNKQGVLL